MSMPTGGALSREELMTRIRNADRPLLTHLLSLEEQVQPNGVDLTLASIQRYVGSGRIAQDNTERVLPDLEPVEPDAGGWFHLPPGVWHLTYNEVVDLPMDLMALGRPRSSLGRSGATIHTAVWDAGYRGRSTSLLNVLNPEGLHVERNARVMQLVFFSLSVATEAGYSGRYQDENL